MLARTRNPSMYISPCASRSCHALRATINGADAAPPYSARCASIRSEDSTVPTGRSIIQTRQGRVLRRRGLDFFGDGRALERHFDACHEALPPQAQAHVGLVPRGGFRHPRPQQSQRGGALALAHVQNEVVDDGTVARRPIAALEINQPQAPIHVEDIDMRLAAVDVALAQAVYPTLARIDLRFLAGPDADEAGIRQRAPDPADGHVDLDQVGIAAGAVAGGFTG